MNNKTEQIEYKLTQSYELINSKFKLSALALDIFYIIAMQVSRYDNELKEYRIDKSEIEAYINCSVHFTDLKKAAESLISCKINLAKRNSKEFYIVPMFYSLGYKEGSINARIHPALEDHFLNLQRNFVSADFINYISKLKSSYVKRMYLILKQREKLNQYEFSVKELREILDIPESFKYADFKRRVLIKSVQEINRQADITVNFSEIKTGRSVTDIIFSISKNKRGEQSELEKEDRKTQRKNKKVMNSLGHKGISELEKWAKEEEEDFIDTEIVEKKALEISAQKITDKDLLTKIYEVENEVDYIKKLEIEQDFLKKLLKGDRETYLKLKAKYKRDKEKKEHSKNKAEKLSNNFFIE